jgi:hypothetical protein
MATAIAIGAPVSLCLWLAARSLGSSPGPRFPIAACGVFLGLSAITVTMLRAEGLTLGFVSPSRALLLGAAAVWSIVLAWKTTSLYAEHNLRRFAATVFVALAAAAGTDTWVVYFWVWQ